MGSVLGSWPPGCFSCGGRGGAMLGPQVGAPAGHQRSAAYLRTKRRPTIVAVLLVTVSFGALCAHLKLELLLLGSPGGLSFLCWLNKTWFGPLITVSCLRSGPVKPCVLTLYLTLQENSTLFVIIIEGVPKGPQCTT